MGGTDLKWGPGTTAPPAGDGPANGVQGGVQFHGRRITIGAPKSPNKVTGTFFNTIHLLAKDLKFDYGSAKHASCPCGIQSPYAADSNKDRFENWQLWGVWKLPLCHHRVIKPTQICSCFINPCINLHFPSTVSREYHPNVAYMKFSTCCLQRVLPWVSANLQ